MPTGSKPNIQNYTINGEEWDGKIRELEPGKIEAEPIVPAETPPSIELTLPLTPEIYERLTKLTKQLTEAFKKLTQKLARTSEYLIDRLLYEANDNPRWWHLYKHAKKARTRKKYKRLLMKQLYKLSPSAR